MMKKIFLILLLLFLTQTAYALKPEQILVVANSDVDESVRLAEYYCKARTVPVENIIKIPLGQAVAEQISREEYDKVLAPVIMKELTQNRPSGQIKCLLTVYGVPIKVGPAGPMENAQQFIPKLSQLLSNREGRFNKAYSQINSLGRAELVEKQTSSKTESYEDILK